MTQRVECELCHRAVAEITRHHLIPRTRHKNRRVKQRFTREQMTGNQLQVCSSCHKFIHSQFTEKDLAERYFEKELLLTNHKVRTFVKWIASKPEGFKCRSFRTRD